MNKQQLLDLGVSEEHATSISNSWAEATKDLVPKSELETLKTTNKTLGEQLTGIHDNVKKLVKDAKGSTLEEQVNNFSSQIEIERANHQKELANMQFSTAIDKALITSGAIDPADIKAFINTDDLKLNSDGKVLGINERLESLKASKPYLFVSSNSNASSGTGSSGNFPRQDGGSNIPNPWGKETFNLTQQATLFKTNPTLANTYKTQAGQ